MKTQNKFRVWNGREMIYDVMVGKFGVFYVNPMAKGNGLDEKDSASLSPFNTKYPDDIPVMRFLGKTDILGKEIYEGDIMKGKFGTGSGGMSTKYKEQYFKIVLIEDDYHGEILAMKPLTRIGNYRFYPKIVDCEIVGHIYEEPNQMNRFN